MIKGIILSVISSFLFGLLYLYPKFLEKMDSEMIFYWRILLSLPAISILILMRKSWWQVTQLFVRVKNSPALLIGLFATAFLLAIEMLLFVWAPINGHAITTSLGYFILPLAIALTGRFIFNDPLSKLQVLAVLIAVSAVLLEIVTTGTFSWDTAVVFIGYPLYFVIRKKIKTDNIGGYFIDMLIIFLICLILMIFRHKEPLFDVYFTNPSYFWLVPCLGIITAAGFGTYFAAGERLPMTLFGLLGYIEPILFVFISLYLLNESIQPEQFWSYCLIFLAIFVLVLDGIFHTIKYFVKKKRAVIN